MTFALRPNRQSTSTSTIKSSSLRRHFPSFSSTFPLYSHPPVRTPLRVRQLLLLGLSESLVRHFSNPPPPTTALPPLVPVISPLFALHHPAFRASTIAAAETDSQLAFTRIWRPFHLPVSCSCALSLLSFLRCKLSLFSPKMAAHLTSMAAAVEGRSSLPVV